MFDSLGKALWDGLKRILSEGKDPIRKYQKTEREIYDSAIYEDDFKRVMETESSRMIILKPPDDDFYDLELDDVPRCYKCKSIMVKYLYHQRPYCRKCALKYAIRHDVDVVKRQIPCSVCYLNDGRSFMFYWPPDRDYVEEIQIAKRKGKMISFFDPDFGMIHIDARKIVAIRKPQKLFHIEHTEPK